MRPSARPLPFWPSKPLPLGPPFPAAQHPALASARTLRSAHERVAPAADQQGPLSAPSPPPPRKSSNGSAIPAGDLLPDPHAEIPASLLNRSTSPLHTHLSSPQPQRRGPETPATALPRRGPCAAGEHFRRPIFSPLSALGPLLTLPPVSQEHRTSIRGVQAPGLPLHLLLHVLRRNDAAGLRRRRLYTTALLKLEPR